MSTRATLPLMVLLARAAAQATDYSMGCFTAIVQYGYIWQAYSFVIDSLRLTWNGMALQFLVQLLTVKNCSILQCILISFCTTVESKP